MPLIKRDKEHLHLITVFGVMMDLRLTMKAFL
jgi:hypothetical protein